MHGVAFDPESGHVFTGGGDNVVSEVDPVALKVVNHVDVGGSVDAIAYDPSNGRIYADEDDGARVWVVDAKTFKVIKTIAIPGHKPEYLAINPKTHEVYQNIDSESEIAVIDPKTMTVSRTIPTPEIKHNHPLQYDRGVRSDRDRGRRRDERVRTERQEDRRSAGRAASTNAISTRRSTCSRARATAA